MENVKRLREMTGAGMLDCQKALKENNNDIDKAAEFLRKKGIAKAAHKAGREAKEGVIHSYIHTNKRIGVLLELNCETDFVARTDDFVDLAQNLCLQIVATGPLYLVPDDVPSDVLEKERDVYRSQLEQEGKPAAMIDKIVDGKIEKYYQQVCLLKQEYVKDGTKIVEDVIKEAIAKLGENIQVRRFVRYALGE